MKTVYGYIRVSDPKQGEGVSLVEQKSSIENYAFKNNFKVTKWFEEKQTAAKQGRPLFDQMLKLLKRRKADGLIIHKIDRSARNLRDWADLGDMIEAGVEVHFSFESIDFSTRGGRLSADIQAVIAADYIRNLRDETKKGLNGRLKQGLYPFAAPIGYLNTGGGNPKTIDPVNGPLIAELFRLYASGLYGIIQLADVMYKKGLRNSKGNFVCRKRISEILKNPFYFGVIKIIRTGETYQGIHEPLISKHVFQEAQRVLDGKRHHKKVKRNFLYRRCIVCNECGKSLVAEQQKGHVYYRCKAEECPTKTVREEFIDSAICDFLGLIKLSKEETEELKRLFAVEAEQLSAEYSRKKRDWQLELSQIEKRIENLTEKFVDDLIDQSIYNKTKSKWLYTQRELQEKLADLDCDNSISENQLTMFLDWVNSVGKYYLKQSNEKKRALLKTLSPNLRYSSGKLYIEPYSPFLELANTGDVHKCDLSRTSGRKSGDTILLGDNCTTMVYELTKKEVGKFCAVRRCTNSYISIEQVGNALWDSLEQCHDVIQNNYYCGK